MSEKWPRWQDSRGISDLSIALDEVFFLRALLADEAGIIEAHLGYKTFPKTRRKYAEEQVERMKAAAAGDIVGAQRENFSASRALRRLGLDECLTNDMWADQRGLTRVEDE